MMKTLLTAVVGVVALVTLLEIVQSAPVSKRSSESDEERKDRGKALVFMHKFGYLEKTNSTNSSGAGHFDTPEIRKAIKDIQTFGNLAVTGELNRETRNLINTKRCGTKDPVKKLGTTHDVFGNLRIGRYYLQGTYWKKKDLTYRFKEPTSDLGLYQQRDILRKAFNLWVEASTLNIREADPALRDDEVDILIRFVRRSHGDAYPFDGSGGTLAHAFYPHNNKGLSGDAHFDDDERFTTQTSDGINLDWVALHEFGHSLGLEHSNVRESIMYPWYKGYFENIELTNDDILGIRGLYGRRQPMTKKSTTPTVPTTTPRTKPSPTRPPTPRTKPIPTDTPTVHPACKPGSRYDAVVLERDTRGAFVTHFIQGDYFWTADENLRTKTDPKRVRDYWPRVRTPVDAAYRNRKGNIVFFSGDRFWEYNSTRQLTNRKNGNLTQYGLNSRVSLTNMDAVFTWNGNKKTYFFKGTQYWRYDEVTGKLSLGYPRRIKAGWPDFPRDIDAAVTWRNSRSYIFSGTDYLRLSNKATNRQVRKDRNYPRSIVGAWTKCEDVGAIEVGGSQAGPAKLTNVDP